MFDMIEKSLRCEITNVSLTTIQSKMIHAFITLQLIILPLFSSVETFWFTFLLVLDFKVESASPGLPIRQV